MEEDNDLGQMTEEELWMNVIIFDPFDLVGIGPTADLAWGHTIRSDWRICRGRLYPDKGKPILLPE
jgi:hypothetical protein